MSLTLNIAISEPSYIIRSGLEALLRRLPGYRVQIIEINQSDSFLDTLRIRKPEMIIINPLSFGNMQPAHIRSESGCPELKCVALLSSLLDSSIICQYNERITLYDSPDDIRGKIEALMRADEAEATDLDDGEQQVLTSREKEIVVCVVKGMTNREIADKLCLSAHTVITHRRNIARKLQIHSASGLTIYAIVNKLVALGDIKDV